ncbi:CBS domain-containing protein [Cupriavidus campinensis]|uniref:CBS domain-containing protein n=1 Tax=Cupriavidus campinensis TaxID=151783 RepID=A0ABY3EEL5_9BURK|nr:CBS domain-containing protein [Cupriavidus campinensis]TSP09188.1 CBS domain-containing protein [Cupriavidus campinensis]
MKVRDLLNGKPAVVTIDANLSLSAAISVMSYHKIGALVLRSEKGCPVRLLSERDVVSVITARGHDVLGQPVHQVAPEDCIRCDPDERLQEVMHTMSRLRARHIPVVEKSGELIGIVSVGDLLKAQLEETTLENRVLHDKALVSTFAGM